MTRVRRSYLDLRYGQLHLRSLAGSPGAGRPVVCFHLSPLSGAVYEPLLVELGRDRACFAPDTPGFGSSDPPAQPPDIADYVAVMAEMLDRLELSRIDCIGYHTGSRIAVELALLRPEAVGHLLLIGAPVYEDAERRAMEQAYAKAAIEEDGSHLTREWRAVLRWRGPGQSLEDVMRHFPDQMRGASHRHWGHRAAFRHDYRQALPRVACPTLVLNSSDDLEAFTRRAPAYLRLGTYVERLDWGHGMTELHAAELAALARDFFDR